MNTTRRILSTITYSARKYSKVTDGVKIPIHGSGDKSIEDANRQWRATNTEDDENLKARFKKDIKKDASLKKLTAAQSILQQANRLNGEEQEEEEEALKQISAPVEEGEKKQYVNPYNSKTGEHDGPKGPEPTRYGDWERKGRIYDF
ncbi:succinate dehydrogenase assembly factor 4, mitochondrial [Acrasis kona]|uniref:Succinate dehydrogenase assembly factor 4, mitochondrial n=1 Tax=Acrasis kona TaxID=1008807 RepID=A0AAW2ZIW0_9EUKA